MKLLIAAFAALSLSLSSQAKEAAPLAEDPVVEQRLTAIAEELRCLVCQNESLAGSRADLAQDLRREVRDLIKTGKTDQEVKDFLVRSLKNVYLHPAKSAITGGGWACNDLFPAWAIYTLTGERRYLEDNFPFLKALMDRPGNFPWGGNDMHFYLGELDRLGLLGQFV